MFLTDLCYEDIVFPKILPLLAYRDWYIASFYFYSFLKNHHIFSPHSSIFGGKGK